MSQFGSLKKSLITAFFGPKHFLDNLRKTGALRLTDSKIDSLLQSFRNNPDQFQNYLKEACKRQEIAPKDLLNLAKLSFQASQLSNNFSSEVIPNAQRKSWAKACLKQSAKLCCDEAQIIYASLVFNQIKFTEDELKTCVEWMKRVSDHSPEPEKASKASKLLGVFYQRLGKAELANTMFQRAAALGDAESYVMHGRIELANERKTQAKWAFEKAASMDHPLGYFYLSNLCTNAREKKTYLLKAASFDGCPPEVAHNLALIYDRTEHNDKLAIEWYTVAASNGLSISRFNLAQLYQRVGDYQAAMGQCDKIASVPGSIGKNATRLREEIRTKMALSTDDPARSETNIRKCIIM
ncbi:hypothetical protein SJAG_00675 [Schizosaccharomyces japonicus yFS275]|uniref:Uncharacterized protein n=1 Tax=Schizosaccharomyces japonicus (strain yFS275 / FY16936) TaxID=402676 RepID=B6JWA2_SCHJY|nr:hypothetical protein SJAG_00675 [Schizosaccharomyces japonicus yFS275]EEB05653.2 hypothetical protein SJAG_00675 [Schizosaccharomyces japonicus yFS275]